MKPCPFCGLAPLSSRTLVWCWGGWPDDGGHGLIQMKHPIWEKRADEEVVRSTVTGATMTFRRDRLAAQFDEDAKKLASLMDFGHGDER